MKTKVAIIGKGNVGGALQKGLQRAGYELRVAGKDPAKVKEAGAWAEVVILAVPYSAIDDTLKELGDGVTGKTLVDATNVLGPNYQLALGFTTSGAEELAKKAPGAKVVKAFNTVFAANMSTGKVKGEALSLLPPVTTRKRRSSCSDWAVTLDSTVDAGPLVNARWLETLGFLNIQLGFTQKMGTDIGFRLVH